MKKSTKFIAGAIAFGAVALGLVGCSTQADTVSYNLSQEAEDFKVDRRIVFINGITDKYLLEISGKCNIETGDSMAAGTLEVVCKVAEGEGPASFKKHFLGLSDNVTFIVEQTSGSEVDPFHYKVFFRPETIVPDIDLKVSGGDDEDDE